MYRLSRGLMLGLGLLVITGGFVWYVVVNRPSADVTGDEAAESLTTQAALQGSGENVAETHDVTISPDGTIELTPEE